MHKKMVGDEKLIGKSLAPRPVWFRYGAAFLAVVLGWLAREALTPALGQTALPFVFFFPAVAIAAWCGGLGPGLLAIGLSMFIANWFFITPGHAITFNSKYDTIAFASFLLAALLIVVAIQAMHRARGRLADEIAERRRTEVELTEARDLLSTTVASIGDAVIATDERGHVTLFNSEAERLTGWKQAEAKGQPLPTVFRVVSEQTRQPIENPVETVLRTGTVAGLGNHALLVSREGSETPIDDSAAPIRHGDSRLFGVVLVFRDVSAQRRSNLAAAQLAAIVEHSGDAILTKNLQSVIQTWNPSAERLFGYRAEEIVGKPVTTLFPPDRFHEEETIIARLRQGRLVERLETIRVTKDGRHIPVAVSVSPLRNSEGEIVGASKIVHDISDVVAAREALVREKELLATTLASIGDAVIVTDAKGLISFMNSEAERLTEWTNAEASNQPLPVVFRIVNEETRTPVEDPVQKVLRLGGVVGLANHTILIGKNGMEIPIDDSAAPIRQQDGPLFGVVLIFRDFSERKRAEAELREAQRKLKLHATNLEATVAERTAKLRETVHDLQRFSYSIAHDLRAPLRAMGMFAQLLQDEVAATGASPQVKDFCERIIIGAARLDNLINDALNYTKAALQESPLVPVNLEKLLHGLIDTYPNLQPATADIEVEPGLPSVLGNESFLTQCFSNLLGNAVKFVSPGVRPKVRVSSQIKGGVARIRVEDNGIGIPPHAQARLFGMFQKLDNAYEGTGIGLAIVRKVVERMDGKVGVESQPGQGSCFWVELHIAPDQPAL